MKFTVREGFVVRLLNRIEVSEGQFETQELNYYGGQSCDLSAEQADLHTHKLDPADKAAAAYLAAKVPPVSDAAKLNLSPEQLALVQAMAAATAQAMLSAMQTPAPAAP